MSPIVIGLITVGVLELISLWFIVRWTFTEPTPEPMLNVEVMYSPPTDLLTLLNAALESNSQTAYFEKGKFGVCDIGSMKYNEIMGYPSTYEDDCCIQCGCLVCPPSCPLQDNPPELAIIEVPNTEANVRAVFTDEQS